MAVHDAPRSNEMYQDLEPDMEATSGGVKVTRRGNRAVVDFNPGAARVSAGDSDEHSANLVDELDEREQMDLANKLIEWVDTDLEARKDWEQRMDQAMELMGINNIPLEDLPFDGASNVTFPMIGKAVINFQARAIEEIFPSEGPVKTKVVGAYTMEKQEQAERVKNHMNYQILDQDRSYFWETDQMLFYLPLGGSAFKKSYYDPLSAMTVSKFIKSPDFIVPYIATDLYSAPRYTHRMFRNKGEMQKLFESGFYKEIELLPTTPYAKDSLFDDTSYRDQSDDRNAEMHTDDHVYSLYECHCDYDFSFDQKKYNRKAPMPYIVTVERDTRKVLSIRRNWKENDPLFAKRLWFTHYRYLPGLGFYGFGLLHLIGSLAESASGAIRAMLDGAAFSNLQGGYVSNDAKFQPGDEHIQPGVWKEVNMSADELRNAFFTPPFKEPSSALAQLFNMLVEAGEAFSSSTEVMTGEAANTGPVGTTMALIEQGNKPFSAIHRRLHMSAAEEFALRAEINYEFLPDQYPYEIENSETVVMKQDYDGRIDVIPVSDPNIFSSAQRIAQAQAIVQRSMEAPSLYNAMKVEERFLKAIRIPDFEELLSHNRPVRVDAVTENMRMLQGQAVNAFIEQDHDAHIQVHINFLNGLNEDALEVMGPAMQAHMAEHYSYKYYNEINRQLDGQLPDPSMYGTEEGQELPPEFDQMIAQAAAQLPQIQIMPEEGSMGGDPEMEQVAREQERKDFESMREQERKDQEFLADQERKDLEAVSKDQRDEQLAMNKEAREERAHKAKIEREKRESEAKQKREEKLAAAKAKVARKPAAK